MVRIGKLVMQNPVLAEIVAKKSVSGFPLVGTITNTNNLLGQNGIVGIKTCHSDEAGGAYVAAARVTVNGQTATVVTALLAAPSTDDANAASLTLLKSIEANNLKPIEQGGNSRGRDLCGGTGGIEQIISVEKNTITIKRKTAALKLLTLQVRQR